jgi:osmotically inducible protein OsmC
MRVPAAGAGAIAGCFTALCSANAANGPRHPRRGQDEYVWSGRLGRRHQRWQRRHLDEERRARQIPIRLCQPFEGKPGTNPEELIGAAHAACFTMALSLILGEAQLTAEHMETNAEVTLDKVGDGFAITAVHLTLTAKIPDADKAKFEELAAKAKAGCPVSKPLNTKITLDATLAA